MESERTICASCMLKGACVCEKCIANKKYIVNGEDCGCIFSYRPDKNECLGYKKKGE